MGSKRTDSADGRGGRTESRFTAEWYNTRYHNSGERAFSRPAEESWNRTESLRLKPEQVLLDVGCGQGFFLAAVSDTGALASGCDISLAGAILAKSVSSRSRIYVADGHQLPFRNHSFDWITCWGTLEHHQDLTGAVKELKRVAKVGAHLVIRVPNRDFWVFNLKKVVGGSPGTEQTEITEHLLDRVGWESLFADSGLEVVRVSSDDWYARAPISRASTNQSWMRGLVKKLAVRFATLNKTYQFDFLLRA